MYIISMKKSAGILLYRFYKGDIQVFLVHPGGPFFKNKDLGSWTIPKGEIEENENLLVAATREFHEETGILLTGSFIELKPVKLKSGKLVYAWALEGDLDEKKVRCNTFTMEWPPKSGKFAEFPEIDKGEWFHTTKAFEKIIPAQLSLIEQLLELVK